MQKRHRGQWNTPGVKGVRMNVDQEPFKTDAMPKEVMATMRVERSNGEVLVYRGAFIFQHVELAKK